MAAGEREHLSPHGHLHRLICALFTLVALSLILILAEPSGQNSHPPSTPTPSPPPVQGSRHLHAKDSELPLCGQYHVSWESEPTAVWGPAGNKWLSGRRRDTSRHSQTSHGVTCSLCGPYTSSPRHKQESSAFKSQQRTKDPAAYVNRPGPAPTEEEEGPGGGLSG